MHDERGSGKLPLILCTAWAPQQPMCRISDGRDQHERFRVQAAHDTRIGTTATAVTDKTNATPMRRRATGAERLLTRFLTLRRPVIRNLQRGRQERVPELSVQLRLEVMIIIAIKTTVTIIVDNVVATGEVEAWGIVAKATTAAIASATTLRRDGTISAAPVASPTPADDNQQAAGRRESLSANRRCGRKLSGFIRGRWLVSWHPRKVWIITSGRNFDSNPGADHIAPILWRKFSCEAASLRPQKQHCRCITAGLERYCHAYSKGDDSTCGRCNKASMQNGGVARRCCGARRVPRNRHCEHARHTHVLPINPAGYRP